MKRMKQILALLLALALLAGLLAGCAQAEETGQDTSQDASQSADTAAEETSDPAEEPEPAEETPETEDTATERTITDMAGRTMTVPAEIPWVFSTGSVAAIYLYTLAPEKLLGWNYELNDLEKSVILEEYHDLPNFGMGDAINYEAVIASGPTIALNVGTINDQFISDCDALSESLGIPVVAVDGDLQAAPEAYRFLGELLGLSERAEQLAAYAEETFEDIANMNVPEEEKVRVYYGNGEDSLETAPAGSSHADILDLVNAINVADLELGDGSRMQISAEQLLAWDPDVIVVNGEPKADLPGDSAAKAILENPDYAALQAVQTGKVYGTPNAPFSWVDRPPGPNRIVGVRWLSGLLYPEYLNFDVDEEVREFFQLFYHVELTDQQLSNIYQGIVGT